jgi:hypothetical protein
LLIDAHTEAEGPVTCNEADAEQMAQELQCARPLQVFLDAKTPKKQPAPSVSKVKGECLITGSNRRLRALAGAKEGIWNFATCVCSSKGQLRSKAAQTRDCI